LFAGITIIKALHNYLTGYPLFAQWQKFGLGKSLKKAVSKQIGISP